MGMNWNNLANAKGADRFRARLALTLLYFCPRRIHPAPPAAARKNCSPPPLTFLAAPPVAAFDLMQKERVDKIEAISRDQRRVDWNLRREPSSF